MQSGFGAVLVRITAMTVVWLLCAASLTFAGSRVLATDKLDRSEPVPEPPKREAEIRTLTVPDMRGHPYVFAKGMLEESGFAWRVEGDVEGFAANLVVSQLPEPGATVVAEGTPTIILILERNPDYEERGSPENESPYDGAPATVVGGGAEPTSASDSDESGEVPAESGKPKKKKNSPTEAPSTTQTDSAEAMDTQDETEPDTAPPVDEPESEPTPEEASPKAEPSTPPAEAESEGLGGPDFVVPGAPEEPPGAMPLPERAAMIGEELAQHPSATPELVDWYLYQHEWVITGAKFGWGEGAEALEVLIEVDLALYERWGIGAKSADYARETLKEVKRLAKEYGN